MTDYYPSFYIYGSQNDKSHFLPKVGFGYEKEETPDFVRGDANGDKLVNITDVTVLINYLLTDDPTGVDLNGANCNQDEVINITDVTALINFLLTDQW